jgi:hypothetical protein
MLRGTSAGGGKRHTSLLNRTESATGALSIRMTCVATLRKSRRYPRF